jgi:hypothetical protein
MEDLASLQRPPQPLVFPKNFKPNTMPGMEAKLKQFSDMEEKMQRLEEMIILLLGILEEQPAITPTVIPPATSTRKRSPPPGSPHAQISIHYSMRFWFETMLYILLSV